MLATPSVSAFVSASDHVSCLKAAVGIPTRQPNQMLLSAAPTRIVPRLEPAGRWESDATGGAACPPRPPRPPPGGMSCAEAIMAPLRIVRIAEFNFMVSPVSFSRRRLRPGQREHVITLRIQPAGEPRHVLAFRRCFAFAHRARRAEC